MVALLATAASANCPYPDSRKVVDLLIPDIYNCLRDSSGQVQITSITQIPIIVGNIIEILLSIIAVLAVIFVIYAGIQYITSSGDPGKTASAKSTLTNAAVGVILSGSAYLLVDYLARQFTQ